MNHLKVNPKGIDTSIEEIQVQLYDGLISLWANEIDGYGRAYRNKTKDGIIKPEVYDISKKGYVDTYYNNKSCFFFLDGNKRSGDGYTFTSKLDIVFMLNLAEMVSNETDRADELVFMNVIQTIRQNFEGTLKITGHNKGIDNVLLGLDISSLQANDIHPFHVFSLTADLEYFINDNSC